MQLLRPKDHKVLSETWAAGIRIYGSPKKQIIVEKDGEVVKVFNLSSRDDPNKKLLAAYHYYHERGFEI